MSATEVAKGTTRAFSYAEPSAPAWYSCAGCAATGVKLWRPVHSDRSAYCAAGIERAVQGFAEVRALRKAAVKP